MEFNQENRSFCSPVKVLDTVAEQLADVDLTLPDYCPDIEKILKCTLTPNVRSKCLSGGQLQVDGNCIVNVMYVESINKTIRCCEQSVNFSQSFSVREAGDSPAIIIKTKPEYINCRALSPRRLVMHGAFSLYSKVITAEKTEIYSNDGKDLETLKYNVKCADLRSLCQEDFTVTEELSVADKPAVESVLRSDVSVNITDIKAITGKLMLNGEINLRMLYLTDVQTGETAKLDYLLPFNQIIDCKGIDEDTVNCVSCDVMSYDIRLKNDVLSEKPAVLIDVKLCVTEKGYCIIDEDVITDAYSVYCIAEPEFTQMMLTENVMPISDIHMEKNKIQIENGSISKVTDINIEGITAESVYENGDLKIKGKINICMTALDSDNMPMLVERSFEYTHSLSNYEDCNVLADSEARPISVSFRLADDRTVEIRSEIRLSGTAMQQETLTVVNNTEIFEDKSIKSDGCALTLYFASKGEKMWDIAKAHSTKLEMLLNENSSENTALESAQMLLIPGI